MFVGVRRVRVARLCPCGPPSPPQAQRWGMQCTVQRLMKCGGVCVRDVADCRPSANPSQGIEPAAVVALDGGPGDNMWRAVWGRGSCFFDRGRSMQSPKRGLGGGGGFIGPHS